MEGKSRNPHLLIIIVSLLFVVKLIVWLNITSKDVRYFYYPDTKPYQLSALALLRTGSFAVSPDHPDVPQTFRTPGYSVFLAGVYLIFGEKEQVAIFFQILLSLGTIVFVYLIVRQLWDEKIAAGAAVLMALENLTFTYTFRLLTETLFTFLLTIVIFSGVRLLKSKGQLIWAVSLGVSLAVATMVRPVTYYLIVPLALALLIWSLIERLGWKRIVLNFLVVVLPFLLLVGGWQLRNYRLTGSAVFSGYEGQNLLYWHGANIIALRDGISVREAQRRLAEDRKDTGFYDLHEEADNPALARMSESMKQEGLNLIKQHPLLFLRVHVAGIFRLLTRPGMSDFWETLGIRENFGSFGVIKKYPLVLISLVFVIVYLAFLYLGTLQFALHSIITKHLEVASLYVFCLLLYLLAIYGGPQMSPRHRTPLMPLFVILSANWITHFFVSLVKKVGIVR